MNDVFGQIVLARRNPHLVAGEAVAAVALRFGAGANVRQGRTGLRLRQAHGAEPFARQHRPHVGVDLLWRAVMQQQIGVANGEKGIARRRYVGRFEIREHRLRHHGGQLHAAVLVVVLGGHQAGFDEGFLRHADFGDQRDFFTVEGWLVLVALAVVWREKIGGDLFCQIHRSGEGFARVICEA